MNIAEPEAFYHYLLQSFPLEPEAAKVVRLRRWLAEQMTEDSPALLQPTAFIAKINSHALNLGIAEGSDSIHVFAINCVVDISSTTPISQRAAASRSNLSAA